MTAAFALGIAGLGTIQASKNALKTEATATAGTYTYDFVSAFSTYASSWDTSYTSHTISSTDLGTGLPSASIAFGAVNKSTSTLTTAPVAKSSSNTFTLSESGFQITAVEVGFVQWGSKSQTAQVYIDGSASKLYNSSLTFASSKATTGSLAITSNGVTAIHFDTTNASNQVGYSYLKITIGNLVVSPKVTVSKQTLSLPIGGAADSSITATATNFSGTVNWTVASSDETAATASISSSGVITVTPSATLSSAKSSTLTVTAAYSTETATASIALNVGQSFAKITTLDSLVPGSQIIFQDSSSSYVAGSIQGSYDRNSVSLSGGTDTLYSDPSTGIFTVGIGATKGTYTLHDSNGYLYATVSGSYNDLLSKTTLDTDCYWTISVSSGVASFVSTSSTANGYYIGVTATKTGIYSTAHSGSIYQIASSNALSSITIAGTPVQQTANTTFDSTGLTVTATFSDSSTWDVTNWVTWTPTTIASETTVATASFTFAGITKTSDVTVSVKTTTLSSIAITTSPTTTRYNLNDSFDTTGLVITATYSDSSTLDVTNLATLNPANGSTLSTAGTTQVTATYLGKTASFNIVVDPLHFTSLGFSSATDGFVASTIAGAAQTYTIAKDSQRWTLGVTGSSSSLNVYAPSAQTISGTSYFPEQIGNSTNAASTITLRSGLIKGATNSEVKITKVQANFIGASSTSAATVSCTVGSTTASSTVALSGSSAITAAKFYFDSGAYGHITINLSGIAKGIKIINILVTGEADSSDTGKAYAFAHDVEMADSCTTSTISTVYSNLKTAYDALSATAQGIADAIKIDDWADGSASIATADRCSVSEKMAAMKIRAGAGSGAFRFSAMTEDNKSSLIYTISLLGAAAFGAFFFLAKKKKHNA